MNEMNRNVYVPSSNRFIEHKITPLNDIDDIPMYTYFEHFNKTASKYTHF